MHIVIILCGAVSEAQDNKPPSTGSWSEGKVKSFYLATDACATLMC